jgi:hypothetical protein
LSTRSGKGDPAHNAGGADKAISNVANSSGFVFI